MLRSDCLSRLRVAQCALSVATLEADFVSASERALLEAAPHAIAGDGEKFCATLASEIVAQLFGPGVGKLAEAVLKRALEPQADRVMKQALQEMGDEQRHGELAQSIAATVDRSLREHYAVLIAEQRHDHAELLEAIRELLIRTHERAPGPSPELIARCHALEAKLERYLLAAKNVRNRFEYDGGLFVDGVHDADDDLTRAIYAYNAVYDDLVISRAFNLHSVAELPRELASMAEGCYEAALHDVHRRGIFSLNEIRSAVMELNAAGPAPDEQAQRRRLDKRLRAILHEANQRIEALEHELTRWRASLDRFARGEHFSGGGL